MNEPTPQAVPAPQKKRSPLAAILAGIALAASKAKALLVGLKFASLGKLAFTSFSMLASIWLYAQVWGFKFAVGFVILILLHELGHGAAMKSVGVEAGWPIFIPFFGASISLRSMPRSAHDHAVIAYGGPLAGAASSLACAAIGLATQDRFWIALASTGFFLNLFNMIPIQPLDGGRIASGFSQKSWIVGAVLLGGMFFVSHAPQLLIIAAMAAMSGFRRRRVATVPASRAVPSDAPDDPYRPRPVMEPMQPMDDAGRWLWTVRYFGLCFALGAGMYFTHRLLGDG